MNEQENTVPETITLNQFGWVSVKTGAIQLMMFNDEVYNASLLIWVNDQEFPLILETNIWYDDKECVILQAYEMIGNLTDNIYTIISVFNDNGDALEDLDLNDYLEEE